MHFIFSAQKLLNTSTSLQSITNTNTTTTSTNKINIDYWLKLLNKKELLGCIKLNGAYATNIVPNHDFTSFTTVDNCGHIYIFDVFNL